MTMNSFEIELILILSIYPLIYLKWMPEVVIIIFLLLLLRIFEVKKIKSI